MPLYFQMTLFMITHNLYTGLLEKNLTEICLLLHGCWEPGHNVINYPSESEKTSENLQISDGRPTCLLTLYASS